MDFITTGQFAGLPRNHFQVIYADPPWSFRTFNDDKAPSRGADSPYSVMNKDELLKLPVGDLAAKDCALAMWVIGSHLDLALDVGKAWGFTYKTDLLTWVKVGKHDPDLRPISLGFWSRKQTEMVLLFTRGSPKRLDAGVRQLIETNEHVIHSPKREHSRKPDEANARIERLIAGPYIELFARRSRKGWTTWGDQSHKFDDPILRPKSDRFDQLFGDDVPANRVHTYEELL